MASRVRFENTSKTAFELVNMLQEEELRIPLHQREYCWPELRQQEFIDTILQGIPTQAIIMRRDGRGDELPVSLEDGRQRLTTLQMFLRDEILTKDGTKFSDLSSILQNQVRSYSFAVTTYWNATPEQIVNIFDRFQNGTPLTIGERLHSMSEISPIVKLTKKLLLTVGEGVHDRAVTTWGHRAGADRRRKNLLNALMIVAGIAFGPKAITKKWPEIQEGRYLSRPISPEDEQRILKTLRDILNIYEVVDNQKPLRGSSIKNMQWAVGKITGYLIWSFHTYPSETIRLTNGWVEFLSQARDTPSLLQETLQKDTGPARFYTEKRFKMGYMRVFNPAEAERLANGVVEDPEDDDSYESDIE